MATGGPGQKPDKKNDPVCQTAVWPLAGLKKEFLVPYFDSVAGESTYWYSFSDCTLTEWMELLSKRHLPKFTQFFFIIYSVIFF